MILKRHFATRPKKYVERALEIEFVIIEKTILIGHVQVDIGKNHSNLQPTGSIFPAQDGRDGCRVA